MKATLLSWLLTPPPVAAVAVEQKMEVDASAPSPATPASPPPRPRQDPVPEAEIYLRLLIIHHLLTTPESYPKALKLVGETVDKMQSLNRRSMDPIAAKIWFAVERAYELAGDLAAARP